MLTDRQLEESAQQLSRFRQANAEHHGTLEQVLEQFSALAEDYKRLKSDYEEERDSRERYKQLARGQERNPFVLVLIDGDGYVFNDHLVKNGAEGGQRAASLLNDAVKKSLREHGLEDCKIMVRVYANLAGLSKALAKASLAGPEKRSLAPFTANFSRSNDLFDYVDAGELKEGSDFKIRALFRQFVDSAQCKHIFFAGCHDVGYINDLTQYAASRERITLVKGPPIHPQFTKLGMRIEDFPGVFRSSPLDYQPSGPRAAAASLDTPPLPAYTSTDTDARLCAFFPKGQCKYGKNCRFLHVKSKVPNGATSSSSNTTRLEDIRNWREDKSDAKTSVSFQMSSLAKNDNEFIKSGNTVASPSPKQTVQPENAETRTKFLNRLRSQPEGFIAVNKDQQRIDPLIPQPSQEDLDEFNRRASKRKLCNNFHLNGDCPGGENCSYDHTPASEGVVNALKQVVYSNPCPRKGACRRANCMYGHICQRPDCTRHDGVGWCKFPHHIHNMDLTLGGFVPADAPPSKLTNGSAPFSSANGETSKSLAQEHDHLTSSNRQTSSQHPTPSHRVTLSEYLARKQSEASHINSTSSSRWYSPKQDGSEDGAQDSGNDDSSTSKPGVDNVPHLNGSSWAVDRDLDESRGNGASLD